MTTVLVPVKRLSQGKSRLQARLDRETIEQLSTSMLEDVLAALRSVPALTRIGVVSPDPQVASIASAAGVEAFVRPDPGLNPTLEQIAAELLAGTNEHLLVLTADLPSVRSEDLQALLQAGATLGERGVVLAPTHDQGTAALLRIPYNVIPAAFGPQSAKRHAELAAQASVPFQELALPSLALDIDEPKDIETFLRNFKTATRTRAVLLEILEKFPA